MSNPCLEVRGRWRQRALVPTALVLLLAMLFPALAGAQATRTLSPIGGGYTTTSLEEFSRLVIERADGEIVLLLVVPSAYGDDPADRAENIELANERTDQLEDACNTVVADYPAFTGCEAELLMLFDRSEALVAENSERFYDAETDGSYILGGDQGLAMQILANSPAETAMDTAYNNGVVFGGTSAGAAVESQDMINGYTDPGWPYNALERDMVIIWWANDGDDERGLIFGADTIIFDQHFYERGRFGRLLNIVAQSDEQYAGESRLGVGVDWGTGVAVTDETILSRVYGESSMAIIDGEASDVSFDWRGPNDTLSARNLLTHIVAAHPEEMLSYDANRRMVVLNGQDLPIDDPGNWSRRVLAPVGLGTLILGGDLSLDFEGPAFQSFVDRLEDRRPGKVLVFAAGTPSVAESQELADTYGEALDEALPDNYSIRTIAYGSKAWNPLILLDLVRASGVVFVGGDQAQMAGPMADVGFRAVVQLATRLHPVVMTDSAMTAVMGDWYVTDPDPTDDDYQDVGIEDFRADGVTVARGLGIVRGVALEPLVTWDQRWGRLYNLTMDHPDTIVFGISEITTLVIDWRGATVVGERSVIAVDGRAATYLTGDNGALTALNVLMDLYAPGDRVK